MPDERHPIRETMGAALGLAATLLFVAMFFLAIPASIIISGLLESSCGWPSLPANAAGILTVALVYTGALLASVLCRDM